MTHTHKPVTISIHDIIRKLDLTLTVRRDPDCGWWYACIDARHCADPYCPLAIPGTYRPSRDTAVSQLCQALTDARCVLEGRLSLDGVVVLPHELS